MQIIGRKHWLKGILHTVGPLKVLAEQTAALSHLINSQTVLNLPIVSDSRKITLFSLSFVPTPMIYPSAQAARRGETQRAALPSCVGAFRQTVACGPSSPPLA